MVDKELFGNLKHNLRTYKSAKYLDWLRSEFPDKEPHHLLGSQGALKLTDYLVVMVTRTEHIEAEKHKILFFTQNLYRAINHLLDYVKKIENSSKKT